MADDTSYLLDLGSVGERLGRKYGVVPDIHRDDFVFLYLYGMFGNDLEKTLDIYLNSGQVSARKIRDLVGELQNAPVQGDRIVAPMTLLDFASGYGCVARHMGNVFPNGKLVTMDIHEKALYFNAANLHLQSALSATAPEGVKPFFAFDVVFCLSFFSHLPRARIRPWLAKLAEFVKVGGLLMFTTHGATTHRDHLPHLRVDADGYAFERTSEQRDISLDDYGNAITLPPLVFGELWRLPDIELVMFKSAAWWTHQDLYVVRKVAARS